MDNSQVVLPLTFSLFACLDRHGGARAAGDCLPCIFFLPLRRWMQSPWLSPLRVRLFRGSLTFNPLRLPSCTHLRCVREA
jgi:hypothetical protein